MVSGQHCIVVNPQGGAMIGTLRLTRYGAQRALRIAYFRDSVPVTWALAEQEGYRVACVNVSITEEPS